MVLNISAWECFINFLEMLLFYIFINSKLHVTNKFNLRFPLQTLFLLLRFVVISIMNSYNISSLATIITSCILEIVFASIFYRDSYIMKIFWGCMFTVISLIAEYITMFIPQSFSRISSSEILFGGELRVPFSLLYITLIAVIVFLFQCMSERDIQFSPVQKFSYCLISMVGIIIGHYMMHLTLESEIRFNDHDFTFSLTVVNFIFLALFLSLLIYIYQLGRSKEVNAKLMEKQKIHELEELEYHNLIKTTESLREMKHDMDIHLDVIQSLTSNGDKTELLDYINSYHRFLDDTHHLISTGNTAIDCILSSKINIATKLNIHTDFSVIAPQPFPLDPLSLSSLLGNLWNNAIEACQRLQHKEPAIAPYIQFYIKPFQHMVLIHMENNYDGIVKRNSDQSYCSTKDGPEHGIGLKRIIDITENADGIIKINSENKLFVVHVMIPLKEIPYENDDYSS